MGKLYSFLRQAGFYLKHRYIIFVLSAWIVLLTEFMSRDSAGQTLDWMAHYLPEFLLNTLIVSAVLLTFATFTGRTRLAYWITFLIAFALSLVSGIKLKTLGVPLLPWDFVLTGETKGMTQYLQNIINAPTMIGILIFICASIGLLYKFPHIVHKVHWKERAALFIVSFCLLTAVFFNIPISLKKAFGVEPRPWDQSENVLTNGLLLTTVLNLDYMHIPKAENYNEAIVSDIEKSHSRSTNTETPVKPNIIVVLSESFWDPTIVPGLTFSRDPLPYFHALQKSFTNGSLLSPQYGGGTANVEFEVLTGNSMRFLPQGSVPYNQYINRGIDSLASITTRQGYTAAAVSPFHNWFFNSRKVYQDLGFSKFISMEFFNPVYQGPYIADDEVANNIIEQSSTTTGPDFIFANTMENHFGYYSGKFKENTIQVTSEMNADSKETLETYLQGAQGADNMLKKLTDHYASVQEPTIIVFFGDHLPSLGENYQVYKDAGHLKDNDPDFLDKMYRTPVLIWNNYLPQQKEKLDLSPSFLSPYLLQLAKLEGSAYTDFLNDFSKKIPVLPPNDYYSKMNISEDDLKEYQLLQYDIVFGNQYIFKDIKEQIINTDYVLGLGPMVLESVESALPDERPAKEDKKITLTGKYLPHQAVVYLNGKPLKTTWESTERLTANAPADWNKPGNWELQVKVLDSKSLIAAETNRIVLVDAAKK